jgi:hypothetical protein
MLGKPNVSELVSGEFELQKLETTITERLMLFCDC